MNASSPLIGQDLNAPRLPGCIATYLNLYSAPPWMDKREAAHCILAPVIGQYICYGAVSVEVVHQCTYRFKYLHSLVFSEAILALQSEVSRLKKDLEEGLVQLPHLAQKMDYLTSKYRQERRSKTRARSHHRPACNRWEADAAGLMIEG